MRLDDVENMPRVEIKWQQSKGFVDIKGVVDNYLKDLQKKRKKGDAEIETDRDCSVVSRRPDAQGRPQLLRLAGALSRLRRGMVL
jgi:hypothetical protein